MRVYMRLCVYRYTCVYVVYAVCKFCSGSAISCPSVDSVYHPDDLVHSHKNDRHQPDRFDPFDIDIDNACNATRQAPARPRDRELVPRRAPGVPPVRKRLRVTVPSLRFRSLLSLFCKKYTESLCEMCRRRSSRESRSRILKTPRIRQGALPIHKNEASCDYHPRGTIAGHERSLARTVRLAREPA